MTDQKKVLEALMKFQEGYTNRDLSKIDIFIEELISKENDTYAVGTSDFEWCFGWEEVKELIESDWEYWGDFSIDIDNPKIDIFGNSARVVTNAFVTYEFEHSNDNNDNFLEAVKDHLKDESYWSHLKPKEKLTNINYLITQYLNVREEKKRKYKWPVTFTAILTKSLDNWKFKYLEFSMPINSKYPDLRLNSVEEYNKAFKDFKSKMVKFKSSINSNHSIEYFIKDFEYEYLNDDYSVKDVIDKFFVTNDCLIIDGYSQIRKPVTALIKKQREYWDNISLDKNESIIVVNDEVAWFTTTGFVTNHKSENDCAKEQLEDINKIINSNLNTSEKLLRIQRDVSITMKESSRGESYIWPIRLHGFLVKRDDKWLLSALNTSFPFIMILEGKYDTFTI